MGSAIERVITDKYSYNHFYDALTHHSPDLIKLYLSGEAITVLMCVSTPSPEKTELLEYPLVEFPLTLRAFWL